MFSGNILNGLTSVIIALAGLGALAVAGWMGGGFVQEYAEARRMDVETKIIAEEHEMAMPYQEQQLAAKTAVIITALEYEQEQLQAEHEATLDSIEARQQAEQDRLAIEQSVYAAKLTADAEHDRRRNQVWLEAEQYFLLAGIALVFLVGVCLIALMSWASYTLLRHRLYYSLSSQPAYPTRQFTLRPVFLRPNPPGRQSRRHHPQPIYIEGDYFHLQQDENIPGD